MLHFPANMPSWSPDVSKTHPVMVLNLTVLTELELFKLWMLGYAVGSELDRRRLGYPRG